MGGSPKVQSTASTEVEEKKQSAAQLRTQLLETEGGIMGEEVNATKKRETIFGN